MQRTAVQVLLDASRQHEATERVIPAIDEHATLSTEASAAEAFCRGHVNQSAACS